MKNQYISLAAYNGGLFAHETPYHYTTADVLTGTSGDVY